MMTKSCSKVAQNFYCEKCVYNTDKKSSWKKHILTKKHNDDKMMTKSYSKVAQPEFGCDCGKKYKYRQGLHTHQKKCNVYINNLLKLSVNETTKNEKNEKYTASLENQVHQLTVIVRQLIETGLFNKNITNNNMTNTNSFNTINKNEIKIYLSEKCSNALSIQDFVKQLTITMDDLNNAKDSTVQGIVKLVENNLRPLTLSERPMHHIEENEWYVKDNASGWETDNGNKIVHETQKTLQKQWSGVFEKEYPQWQANDNETCQFIQLAQCTTTELTTEQLNIIKDGISKSCSLKKSNTIRDKK